MNSMLKVVRVAVGMLAGCLLEAGAAESTLKIGSKAPRLAAGKWVQGEPVSEFARDKVYLVEFWATWCGPCRTTIPHLNKMHHKYKDKGLVVIGQDVWEEDESEVPRFVKSMGEKMTYRVALDDKRANPKGRMAETWMAAAGRSGIPSAFLVDKEGLLAWVGHPMELEESLIEQVLAGTFDVRRAAKAYEERLANEERLRPLWKQLGEGLAREDWPAVDRALAEMEKLTPEADRIELDLTRFRVQLEKKDFPAASQLARSVSAAYKDNANLLNELAWAMATAGDLDKGTLGVAEDIANQANAAAGGKNGAILDTLARLVFMKGERQRAIALQEKAVAASEGPLRTDLQKTLESYRAGVLPKAH